MGVNSSRGYTLIELVVVTGLVGILTLGMASMFLASLRSSAIAQAEAELKAQGDYAITTMERNLRNAIEEPTCVTESLITYRTEAGGDYRQYYVLDASILDENGKSIFGTAGMSVREVDFECPTSDFRGVKISFLLTVTGKMNETVAQKFATTVAIRSTE